MAGRGRQKVYRRSKGERAVFACMERGARRPGFLVNPERMTTRPLSLGFVGLGVMGRPMVSHLAAAGHALTLYDIAPGIAAHVAATLAERTRQPLTSKTRCEPRAKG
jgi:hypothetical protein